MQLLLKLSKLNLTPEQLLEPIFSHSAYDKPYSYLFLKYTPKGDFMNLYPLILKDPTLVYAYDSFQRTALILAI